MSSSVRVATVVFLALAPLAKETAIITPMALLGWELVCPLLAGVQWQGDNLCFQKRNWLRSLSLLLCCDAAAAVARLPSPSRPGFSSAIRNTCATTWARP